MSRHKLLITALFVATLTATGLAQRARQPQRPTPRAAPIEAKVFQDGSAVLYNVSRNGLLAAYGSYDYTSPATGKTHTVEWDKYFVSALLQFDGQLAPGDQYQFPETMHPSGLGLIKYRNVQCTGALLSTGQAWGPKGSYLRAALASEDLDVYAQLIEVRDRLLKCDDETAEEMLRESKPIAFTGRDRKAFHYTLQRILFEDQDLQHLSSDFRQKVDNLIALFEGALNE